MSIIRVRKDARYFSASNEPFNDTRLSWEARGLMGYLLSKPDGWEVRMADLDKNGPAGSRKLKRMLAELRKCGYMNRIRIKLPDGTFTWTTEVFESPSQNPNPSTSGAFCTSALSTSAKPPDIVSTEGASTELDIDSTDAEIFTALSEMTGGGLNSNTPKFVDAWKEKHEPPRILQAIGIATEKKARSMKYVDEILIGWEANGYPKTREERVNDKRGNGKHPPPSQPQTKHGFPEFKNGRVVAEES